MSAVFYISAAIAVACTILVITRLNAIHALLYLTVSLLAIAVIFFTLGAPFVAALEVIIYAGAIMVLFVFVIMLLNLGPHATDVERSWLRPRMVIAPAALAAVLLGEVFYIVARGTAGTVTGTAPIEPRDVGASLFGPYVLGVELASLLLLAGLVARITWDGGCEAPKEAKPPMVPVEHVMLLAIVLFALGLVGVLVRRNIIFILLGIEIMLNAAGMAFVAAGSRWGQPDGQVMFFFILTMTSAEVSVGLAIVMNLYHRFKTLDADAAGAMKG